MPLSSANTKTIELRAKAIGFDLFSEVENKSPPIFESQWWENRA